LGKQRGLKSVLFFIKNKKLNLEVSVNVHSDNVSFELIDGQQFNLLAEAKPGYYLFDEKAEKFKTSIN